MKCLLHFSRLWFDLTTNHYIIIAYLLDASITTLNTYTCVTRTPNPIVVLL